MLDGIQPSSNGSRQPPMDGTSSLYKILNFIRDGKIHTRINQSSVLYFPKSTDNVIPLSGLAVSEETPDKPQRSGRMSKYSSNGLRPWELLFRILGSSNGAGNSGLCTP